MACKCINYTVEIRNEFNLAVAMNRTPIKRIDWFKLPKFATISTFVCFVSILFTSLINEIKFYSNTWLITFRLKKGKKKN